MYHKALNVNIQASKEMKKNASKVELKPLPFHLRYKFLSLKSTLPLLLMLSLMAANLKTLLDVIRKHRGAMKYNIDDINEISASIFMHRILLNDGRTPSRKPQQHLNPNMQAVIKRKLSNYLKLEAFTLFSIVSQFKWFLKKGA